MACDDLGMVRLQAAARDIEVAMGAADRGTWHRHCFAEAG